MDRTFCFTLEKEEYIEYLSWQISHSKTMRGSRWFIMTSVPALLLTGVLFLRVRNWLFVSSIIALAVLWVLYGAKAVWKGYIRRKIAKQILPRMNIQEFREMSYHFGENGIEYRENGKKNLIPWKDIVLMAPMENQFAFCYAKGAVLIPYRVFEGEEDMKQFVKDCEICRRSR